ncbi:MAG: glutamate mutase L [Acutalibacteraceae bacterium]
MDVGGATTDVYSIAEGMPRQMNQRLQRVCRSRMSSGRSRAISVCAIPSRACWLRQACTRLAELSGLSPERVEALVQLLAHNTQTLPEHDTELEMLDYAVASMAVQTRRDAPRRYA